MLTIIKEKVAQFKFQPFSIKQKKILTWWVPPKYDKDGKLVDKGSPFYDKDALICDGAVRSGKTIIMSFSFVNWAMSEYNGAKFGMAGKTIGSFRRNVLFTLKIILKLRGYLIREHRDENYIEIKKYNKETDSWTINYFYIFGGKDERSQDLVQGFTSAGFFFDEVALMPESFVNQAVARCSVEGRKFWFNCNPEGPFHWFKLEWIDKLIEKNALRLHFELEDNPSLSAKMIESYKRMFSGIFYQRFILGLWVLAEGIIYSMFQKHMVIEKVAPTVSILKKWIGIDYGQSNATVFLLCGLGSDGKLYILSEYYHEGKKEYIQKSPSKYSKDYFKWKIANGVEGIPVRTEYVFIDPSAKGFMLQLHEDGERQVRQANNEVLRGIELVSSLIDNDMIRVLSSCKNTLSEFSSYRWCPKGQERGVDTPIKQHDHAMDALRYVVNGTRLIWQKRLIEKTKEIEQKLPRAN
jgi:PBSX family phage terminase large subunit